MIAAQPFSFTSLTAALVLVGLALLLSWRQHLDIEREMGFACIRALVQLMAIGYVINLILRADRPVWPEPIRRSTSYVSARVTSGVSDGGL